MNLAYVTPFSNFSKLFRTILSFFFFFRFFRHVCIPSLTTEFFCFFLQKRHEEQNKLSSVTLLFFFFSMSVLDRLTSLIPQVSSPPRQTKKPPSVSLSHPLSLSSPVIKKKPIQITSFDEKGVSSEKHSLKQTNTDR